MGCCAGAEVCFILLPRFWGWACAQTAAGLGSCEEFLPASLQSWNLNVKGKTKRMQVARDFLLAFTLDFFTDMLLVVKHFSDKKKKSFVYVLKSPYIVITHGRKGVHEITWKAVTGKYLVICCLDSGLLSVIPVWRCAVRTAPQSAAAGEPLSLLLGAAARCCCPGAVGCWGCRPWGLPLLCLMTIGKWSSCLCCTKVWVEQH